MKLTICLFIAATCFSSALALISEDGPVTLANYQKDCVQQSSVPLDHLQMARLDRQIYADEAQEKFAVCMLQKINVMNLDGSIRHDTFYFLLTDNPETLTKSQDCVALAGANVRETARKIMTCFMQLDIPVIIDRPHK